MFSNELVHRELEALFAM